MRQLPNIMVTGTPGVGKTTTCTELISRSAATTSSSITTGTEFTTWSDGAPPLPRPVAVASGGVDGRGHGDVYGGRCDGGIDTKPSQQRQQLLLKHLSINQLVRDKGLFEAGSANATMRTTTTTTTTTTPTTTTTGEVEENDCLIVDEDRLVNEVGRVLGVPVGFGRGYGGDADSDAEEEEEGGWLIDWHACDLFPREWVDLVVVLRCERTEVLWDRLEKRKYPDSKLQENLDAEIFGILAEEARDAFGDDDNHENSATAAVTVVELKSETAEQVDENCDRILTWIQDWLRNRNPSQTSLKAGKEDGQEQD